MNPIKILLCHNYYQHNGGESLVLENQVKGLRSRGHTLLTYHRNNNEILNYSLPKKLQMVFSGYSSQKTRLDIQMLVESEKPDVAIVQNVFPLISPSVYTTLHALKIPIIQAVYNYHFVCPQGELYTDGKICERCLTGNFSHAVMHRCYRGSVLQSMWYASILGLHRALKTIQSFVDAFMVPDDFLGSKLIQGGLPKEKIHRNPNPFFVSDFEPSDRHSGNFVYVGRLIRQKGIFTLLKAVEQAGPAVRLRIVGQGEAQNELLREIDQHGLTGRVDFLGPKWGNEAVEIIRDSTAVIIPSEWYDNLPLILCQANACGKLVIASRINGIPEYVNEGENGFLFTTGNSLELAQTMNRVAAFNEQEYALVSRLARSFAERELDYENHYQKLCQIIQSLG